MFDVSVLTAAVLWVALALGTNLLPGLATGNQSLVAPPFIVLLPLLTLTVSVYCAVRFLYTGDRTERIMIACVALSMLVHAVR